MSSLRTLPRLIIILACALAGMGACVLFQARRIAGRPQEFRSLAKLVAGGQLTLNQSIGWKEQQADFYGTITETLESAEMKRRAWERVKALNPELKECDVEFRVAQTKGSAIFNILATGSEPKYTRTLLDALLDEFIAFRQSIREQAQGKVLQQFLQDVVTKQKMMEDSHAKLQKVRERVDTLSVKSEIDRLVVRLTALRNHRDDLRFKLKALKEDDPARATLQSDKDLTEEEIRDIERDLQRMEPDLAELKTLKDLYDGSKLAYEKLFNEVEKLQSAFNADADYVAIQERATPAAESVEDWVQPVVVGGAAGGLFGGLLGLVLSLIILRKPSPPQIPTAI